MKTTTKEFNENLKVREENKRIIRVNTELIRRGENTLETDKELDKAEKILECQQECYFDKLEKVNVSFMVGYRLYYGEVIKVGSYYYDNFTKMTKLNGYRAIDEIEEITGKMREDMISDMYYY
jgi:hypothetical protein